MELVVCRLESTAGASCGRGRSAGRRFASIAACLRKRAGATRHEYETRVLDVVVQINFLLYSSLIHSRALLESSRDSPPEIRLASMGRERGAGPGP